MPSPLFQLDRLLRNKWGTTIENGQLYVYERGPNGEQTGIEAADLYKDELGTPAGAQPFTSDTEGAWALFAEVNRSLWTYCAEDLVRPWQQWTTPHIPSSIEAVAVTEDRTLELTDAGKALDCNSATDIEITVPDHADVPIPVGTTIEIQRLGIGAVTFIEDTEVTVYTADGLDILDRFSGAALRKLDANVWLLSGNVSGIGAVAADLADHETETAAADDVHGAKTYADAAIAALVAGAPAALDTLNEIAVRLEDEEDATVALLAAIAAKQDASTAATDAELAAVLGVRRKLLHSMARLTTAAAAGNKYVMTGATTADSLAPAGNSQSSQAVQMIQLDPAGLAIAGLTPKLRIAARGRPGNTNPAVTATVKLYPHAITGGNLAPGAAVAGSDAAVVFDAASTPEATNGADFNVPAAGEYLMCVEVSGAPTSSIVVEAELQLRYV